jgi:hypothetical protein
VVVGYGKEASFKAKATAEHMPETAKWKERTEHLIEPRLVRYRTAYLFVTNAM